MQDPNSKEAILQRSSQEDPIIMYFVVRESLNMSVGKIAAQCAHAAQILLLKYFNNNCNDPILFEKWLNSSFRKVVLRADDKEFSKIKDQATNIALVVDNGLTEVSPGTETVIGLLPIYKSQSPKYIKRLQVLK
jgi:PTH2 family peptidyl-tRNA hydrolase